MFKEACESGITMTEETREVCIASETKHQKSCPIFEFEPETGMRRGSTLYHPTEDQIRLVIQHETGYATLTHHAANLVIDTLSHLTQQTYSVTNSSQ